MPRKKSYITATDCFCGAGGSSQGARRAGVEVKMALNHWKLAIETHSTNFPETDHDCTDVSACDPRRYPSTDIGIFSPECTTHSPAGGNNHRALKKQMDLFHTGKMDPATERSRATMWDVVRFSEYHNYNLVIVENVVEALTRWGLFDAWLHAMHMLGYLHRCVFLNSMHCHPTPQSRDRMYVVFWKKGNRTPRLDYTPLAHCQRCSMDVPSVQTWKDRQRRYGKYRTQYVYCCPGCSSVVEPYYYAAFNCIDWSNLGTRIGDRKKPLAEKTIARIQYGLEKYGRQPMVVRNQTPGYSRPLLKHIGTITTDDTNAVLSPPFLTTSGMMGGLSGILEPKRAQTTADTDGIVVPFIYASNHGGDLRPATGVKFTQTTQQSEALVTVPFVPVARGKSKAHSSLDALSTQSQMINHGIVSSESWKSFISYYYGSHQASGINETLGSCTTKDRHQLITYQQPAIEDCYYRMLFPNEVQRAMAFADDYIVLGTNKDKVKQLGNAVTPPAMEWLIKQAIESLESYANN